MKEQQIIPTLKRIAAVLKEKGNKEALQIHYGGRMSAPEEVG